MDGSTTTEYDFLGYLGIMLCCKTEVAYREVAYSECVVLLRYPARQRLLVVDIANRKALSRQRLLGNVKSGGVVDDLPLFDDVPPDLSLKT
ncbi:uncharacterized protein DS421_9g270470 [Arachis hypogaea]|nr:uncharacterized protein DS421_9g270470 [Arachis hypogaea]